MDVLVKFIAVDNTTTIGDNYNYIHNVYKVLNAYGLIKNLILTPDEVSFGAGPIRSLDDEDTVFMFKFMSEENGKSDNWEIYFQFGTCNTSKQLEILIYSDTYDVDKRRNYLEKLKLKIKSIIVKEWRKIIWLVDRDSECLAVELYPRIYKTENLMREVINEVMTKQYGTDWWDSFAPTTMKEKHRNRLKDYKSKVPAFNNVDERLMSIDIDDLGELIVLKRYKWVPQFDTKISGYLNGVQTYNEGAVHELLLKQRTLETDLWSEHFSKYLPSDFYERYKVFTKDRNHIMHNKLIDRVAFHEMKTSIVQVENDLIRARNELKGKLLSKEEEFEIEKQKQIEMLMQKEIEHECKENDANVSIRDLYEIKELFQESLLILLTNVEEEMRFRYDAEIVSSYKDFAETGEFVLVRSKIDGKELQLKYEMTMFETEGAESELRIYCEEYEFDISIKYVNGEAEYDDESGLYMPVTEDSLDDVESFLDDIMDFINSTLVNYKEEIESDDLVDYVMCAECGDECICINEEVFPVGTCLNCGYENEMCICEKCGQWFNNELDGTCFDGEDGEQIAICQNCLDKMEED